MMMRRRKLVAALAVSLGLWFGIVKLAVAVAGPLLSG